MPKRPTKQKGAEKERREHVIFVTYSNIAPGCPKKKGREREYTFKRKKGDKKKSSFSLYQDKAHVRLVLPKKRPTKGQTRRRARAIHHIQQCSGVVQLERRAIRVSRNMAFAQHSVRQNMTPLETT